MPETLIVAEKPAVARDIARVVGAHATAPGCIRGNGYTVTWAIGHLVTLPEPAEISPDWKVWRTATLPMLPETWPLKVVENTKDQFQIVKRLLKECEEVICATDAGREGELIFRYIYEAAKCKKPVRRLWVSSLTDGAIRDGFARLRAGSEYDALAAAARGRSQADWLVGMNLSRAYGLAMDQPASVGRVQTPTLAMLVAREREIRAFVPEDYLEVVAKFRSGADVWEGTWFKDKVRRLPIDGAQADEIVARAHRGSARVASVKREEKRVAPPLLYDLTELQRHANRLFGFSAQRTLDAAQVLYERHKLISYPRTDSRHLSAEVAKTLPSVVEAIRGAYEGRVAPLHPLSRRFVDDSQVTDHHAIIPTAVARGAKALGADEERLYDMICRRLLSAWHDDHLYASTRVVTEIRDAGVIDTYESLGNAVVRIGWKVLDYPRSAANDGPSLPPAL